MIDKLINDDKLGIPVSLVGSYPVAKTSPNEKLRNKPQSDSLYKWIAR